LKREGRGTWAKKRSTRAVSKKVTTTQEIQRQKTQARENSPRKHAQPNMKRPANLIRTKKPAGRGEKKGE